MKLLLPDKEDFNNSF